MAFEFKLPDIGEGVHEGEITRWLVAPGDAIQEDAPMVEIMTDKVTVEITSPVTGVVSERRFEEGATVNVGAVILTIETEGAATKSPAKIEASTVAASTAPVQTCATASPPMSASACSTKVLAAPAARKLARTMGVDLAAVSGSGPLGRIRKADVLAQQTPSSLPARPLSVPSVAPVADSRVPFKGMRKRIAEHLVHAKHTAPHFTYVEEADFSALVAMKDDLAPVAQSQNVKLTYLPFIVKAVCQGIRSFPIVNSSLDEANSEIVLKGACNIGIAVATDDGLVVPVIHNAQALSLFQIAAEISRLSDLARRGKLALSDLQGGTFTLTSIGSIGGIFSAPIINHPEVAIMGIQKVEKRPVVRNDEIVIREMTYLSISCDHRVVDGADAAKFMKDVIGWLEHPARLLV